MTPDEIKKLKKVDKAAATTAAQRLAKKLGKEVELPVGGAASGAEEDRAKAKAALEKQAAEAVAKYPDVCKKCGAPSGPSGCSLASLPQAEGFSMVLNASGEPVRFANQCDELAEFTRLSVG